MKGLHPINTSGKNHLSAAGDKLQTLSEIFRAMDKVYNVNTGLQKLNLDGVDSSTQRSRIILGTYSQTNITFWRFLNEFDHGYCICESLRCLKAVNISDLNKDVCIFKTSDLETES